MNEVLLHLSAPVAAEVAADGAGCRGRRVGRPGEGAEALDHAFAGDPEGEDGAAFHELDERFEERLALVLCVVLHEQRPLGLDQLHVDEGVSLRFDPAQDLTGQVAGDAIRLDQYEGFFDLGAHELSFWLSNLVPTTMQYVHMAANIAPTKNIVGLRKPVATTMAWIAQPA